MLTSAEIKRLNHLTKEELLDRFCNKRSSQVLLALEQNDGPMRYGELKEATGIKSEKIMSDTLTRLVEDDMVHKDEHLATSSYPTYTLTEIGKSWIAALEPLFDWLDENHHTIKAHRMEYIDQLKKEKQRDSARKRYKATRPVKRKK